MKHYILLNNRQRYSMLSKLDFDSSSAAMEFGKAHLLESNIELSDNEKLTVVAVSNSQELECLDGEIAVSNKRKMRSYYCSYWADGEWVAIDTPVLAKNKVFVEMTLMNHAEAFSYLDKAFYRDWGNNTKWKVKYDTMNEVEVIRFPYIDEPKRVVRYRNKNGEIVTADNLSSLELAAFNVLSYVKIK